MEENISQVNTIKEIAEEATPEERKAKAKELQEQLLARIEERKAKSKEASEAIAAGKGVFALETPITAGDEDITELKYDFTALTGMEYVDAMDSDINARQAYKITYRQALALFAQAAAKQTDRVDMRDIVERMGMTDAVEAVQLATLFFSASTRAGQLRISKM